MLVISTTILFNGVQLQNKNLAYAAQEHELQLLLEDESERTEEINELADYVQTDEYVEKVAREKLGLAYPNEIIFEPAE
jgi:cell division protein DivIC